MRRQHAASVTRARKSQLVELVCLSSPGEPPKKHTVCWFKSSRAPDSVGNTTDGSKGKGQAPMLTRRKQQVAAGVIAAFALVAAFLGAKALNGEPDAAVGGTVAPYLPYTSGSYFKSHPTDYGQINAALTSAMQTYLTNVQGTSEQPAGQNWPVIAGVGGNKWGTVYAEGTETDPIWKLKCSCTLSSKTAFLATTGFHAPSYFGKMITGTSDSPFAVLDMAGGFTVKGTKAQYSGAGNVINVGQTGVFYHSSNGLDAKRPESNDTRNTNSRGVIPDTQVIRKDTLEAAVANGTGMGYVLEVFWPETDSAAGHYLPMVGHEGSKSGWGGEGQRIGVDPSLDLSTRTCSPYALAIAKTLQDNGAYIGDNAGSAGMTLKAQQDTTVAPVWGTSLTKNTLKGCIKFSDFVAYTTPR